MNCPSCGHDVSPEVDFDQSGPVKRCPRSECAQVIAAPKPEPEPAHESQEPRKRQRRAVSADGSEPVDVLKVAKKRHAFLKRETKKIRAQLKKLEAEEIKLSRLLKAAESPVAEVKSLRRSGS